ncbi:MAG: hypothetical protein ACFB21_01400 [Opitutales bacterium]
MDETDNATKRPAKTWDKRLVWIAVGLFVLMIFAAIMLLYSSDAGRLSYEATKAELEADGFELDWEEWIPEVPPEHDNLILGAIMEPARENLNAGALPAAESWREAWPAWDEVGAASNDLREIFVDWGQVDPAKLVTNEPIIGDSWDALSSTLEPYRELLAELRKTMAERPRSMLPGDYSDPFASPFPSFYVVRAWTRLLAAEGALAVQQGNGDLVLANVRAIARLVNLNEGQELFINAMVETHVRSFRGTLLITGIEAGIFSNEQLEQIIYSLADDPPLASLTRAFEGELAAVDAGMNAAFEELANDPSTIARMGGSSTPPWLFALFPDDVLWRMLERCLVHHSAMQAPLREAYGRVDYAEFEAAWDRIDAMLENPFPFDYLAALILPATNHVLAQTLEAQTWVNFIRMAAALELYRRETGAYPNALREVEGAFIEALPEHPVIGEAYRYQRVAEDCFRLESFGPDGAPGGGDDVVYELEAP